MAVSFLKSGKKKNIRLLIITGLSGSGKSTAVKALEDIGFFCIDNLPVALLPDLVKLLGGSGSGIEKVAVVMDVRERNMFSEFSGVFSNLKKIGQDFHIIFLDARDDVLIRRYKETRRLHPMTEDDPKTGIEMERKALEELRSISHMVIDTSEYNPHELRERIFDYFKDEVPKKGLNLTFISFGYKYGTPIDADIVIDVRFLPNPYFKEELKEHSGLEKKVTDYILKIKETKDFLEKFEGFLRFLLPNYIREGKSYFNVAIGCTGGVHRSVVIVKELAKRLSSDKIYVIKVNHRDLNRL